MAERQHTTPLIIRDGSATPLVRVPFSERLFDEGWLQQLLFDHPSLLPAGEIEPVCGDLVPVVRELPTDTGPVDLLYLNADGYITIVETKLWRNPEARRKVVAQIIDYAKAMSRWTYDDLVAATLKAGLQSSADPLLDLFVEDSGDFDAVRFIDRVTRNLRLGRFLLLIVGDGIQEGVEQMSDFLQQTPQLAFTLGLVEIAMYRLSKDTTELFVQPRIVARTQEITRAVVEVRVPIKAEDVSVTLPNVKESNSSGRRKKITEEDFFDELSTHASPEVVQFARSILNQADEHNLVIRWGDAGPLLTCLEEDSGEYYTLGQLNRNGTLDSLGRLAPKVEKNGLPNTIWEVYLDEVASLVPGAARRMFTFKTGRQVVTVTTGESLRKDKVRLASLVGKESKWLNAIDRTIGNIETAIREE